MLGLQVRIPPGACMSDSCNDFVLSRRGLCDGLITCPEESYRVYCFLNVIVVGMRSTTLFLLVALSGERLSEVFKDGDTVRWF